MNIYDISRKADVSIATVSRVLNNSPHVSAKTRERVMAVIQENGYVPNVFARGLGLNSMKTIGLVCPDASDPYLAKALADLENGFRCQGYNCLLVCTGVDLEDRKIGISEMLNRHVDGIVLIGSSFAEEQDSNNEYIRQAAATVPVVLLNAQLTGSNIYSVICDDTAAIHETVERLTRHGKKNILFLQHARSDSARRKLTGYRDGIRSCGLALQDELVQFLDREDQDITGIQDYLAELHQKGLLFDSVLCSSDLLAVGCLKYAISAGLRVPEDLEIIGYDNNILSQCTQPELSSVDSRLSDMCGCVVSTMMQVLAGEEAPSSVTFSPELILRGSTIR